MQHDRDARFSAAITAALKRKRIKSQRNDYRSPNLNAFVERFIQTIRRECLDHFLVLGCRHLDYLCRQFLEHYHAERPHQSLDNEPILPFPKVDEPGSIPPRLIRCKTRLGGLLKSYSHQAA